MFQKIIFVIFIFLFFGFIFNNNYIFADEYSGVIWATDKTEPDTINKNINIQSKTFGLKEEQPDKLKIESNKIDESKIKTANIIDKNIEKINTTDNTKKTITDKITDKKEYAPVLKEKKNNKTIWYILGGVVLIVLLAA